MKALKLIIILFIIFKLPILAQDFEIAPVSMNFIIDPGETESKLLSVKNHANFETTFSIDFADFTITNDGERMVSARNSTKNSCADWITVDETHVTLAPNESKQLKVTMSPPDGNYNSRWTIMYVHNVKVKTAFNADKKTTRTGINMSGRIAVHIYRTPKTRNVTNVTIKHLEEIEMTGNKRTFSAIAKNEGNVISKCKITFIAANLKTAKETEFTPISFKIFPSFSRNIKFELPNTLPAGEYSLVALLDFGNKKTLSGTRLNKKLIIVK